ncbi:hypothetical protein F4813DRAFT_373183 [Daldinia decipiens]|uniref:uncharacterized protein n=1 Tax=Daldinia decipiens TaxID=326647 RepID=UPI0020C3E044|nr:uncharacterized protein F4813DRAFT_373183 [Daldinia decipiens]KAI1653904.1 hypothetical protein F4813DRAFT_373183 [Daldinia decipiens]
MEQSDAACVEAERARLRRNQRNSRARKQAYIQNLEKQWNECMRLGAQATIEMQKEARRIQEENRVLRTLLHDQGFDDVAIQRVIDAAKLAEESTNQMQNSQDSSKTSTLYNCNFSPIPCLSALSRTERPQLSEDRDDKPPPPPVPHNCVTDLFNPEDVFNTEININDQTYQNYLYFTEILSDETMNFPALYDAERDLPALPLQDEDPTHGSSRRADNSQCSHPNPSETCHNT